MTNGIFDYLADIYNKQGIDAREDADAMLWKLYETDKEAFTAYCANHSIDLDAPWMDDPEDQLTLWAWDHDD